MPDGYRERIKPSFPVGCTCAVTLRPGKQAKVDRSHCPIHHHLAGKA